MYRHPSDSQLVGVFCAFLQVSIASGIRSKRQARQASPDNGLDVPSLLQTLGYDSTIFRQLTCSSGPSQLFDIVHLSNISTVKCLSRCYVLSDDLVFVFLYRLMFRMSYVNFLIHNGKT